MLRDISPYIVDSGNYLVHMRLARGHDNLVDGQEDQLHEEAQEAHRQKPDGRQTSHLKELLFIRLLALLQQPDEMICGTMRV